MKKITIIILLLLTNGIYAQYKIDNQIKNEFRQSFKNISEKMPESMLQSYKSGISLLYKMKADTLNKEDIDHSRDVIKVYDLDTTKGEIDSTDYTSLQAYQPSKKTPWPFFCICDFRKDTLVITSGIAIFGEMTITTKILNNKVTSYYKESDSNDKIFKRKLTDDLTDNITIPAKVTFLRLNKIPNKNTFELFGKMRVTTSGYYYYQSVYGFKTDYIHQRMNFDFLFRCDLKKSK